MARQAENGGNQQHFIQQGNFQCPVVATAPNNGTLFVNQGVPFEGPVPGHEEVMDHSGAYDSVTQQLFPAATGDNAQMTTDQGITSAGQVLMEISSANQAVDYSFDYSNVLQGESFTAQLEQTVPAQSPGLNESNKQNTVLTSPVEQPQMPSYSTPQQQYLSPLEEIQAQQLVASRVGNVLSPPNQYVGNVDPFSSSRQIDTSNQQRKGRLPRNVSDSQLYTMDLSQLGTSFQTNLFPSMESNLPPQLEAPNLAAHLQSIQPRTRIASSPATATQAKKPRLPRNMSDSRLSSLTRSPTSPPSLPTVQALDVSNQPSQPIPGSTQQSGKRKPGRFPRVMSDTSLLNMGQQQQQLPLVSAVTNTQSSQRRRKMSDPQHVINAAVAAMPPHTASFTSAADTQLYRTSTSLSSVSNTQFLEQLLTVPASSSSSGGVSTTPQAAGSFQSSNNSVLSQLLTQQSAPPTAAPVQMPARDSSTLGGSQDPALLNQLYQLKQVLQKQTVPTELVNALNSLTNTGTAQAAQEQTQAVQQKTTTVRPSLQMKPQNQNAITQALQSLLRASPNVAIQPSTSSKQQVSSFSAQTSITAPVVAPQNIPVPTVTIKHQPQNKPPSPAVNKNVLPSTPVILTPQGGIQSPGMSVQDTQPSPVNNVPVVTTAPTPQVVNIGHPAIQGQRIILPANVNLSTLSLAQLGLSPATLQSVSNQFCQFIWIFFLYITVLNSSYTVKPKCNGIKHIMPRVHRAEVN